MTLVEIEQLVPEGLCQEPVGRLRRDGREVGVYRCTEERDSLLHELDPDIVVVVE